MLESLLNTIHGRKERDTTLLDLEPLLRKKADALPLDREAPENAETASFALGCFWGPDAIFGIMPGVYRTRVGYAGGDKENPSYHSLGTHTETVQIDYDPGKLSFDDLLDIFWKAHDPTIEQKTQYRSIIFYHDEKQRRKAKKALEERQNDADGELYTSVEAMEVFHPAELYHQKYHLKQYSFLMEPLLETYTEAELVNSTVAARLNGFVAGQGSMQQFNDESDRYGLSDEVLKNLKEIVENSSGGIVC